jgi:hypothetical protein
MIKIFIPENKGKVKTSVRGFWYSQDSKRTYYDYLTTQDYRLNSVTSLYNHLENLKKFYSQECIAYNEFNGLFNVLKIYYSKDKIEVLNKRSILEVKRQGKNTKLLKDYIKSALRLYGGLTIYIKDHSYILEVFYK